MEPNLKESASAQSMFQIVFSISCCEPIGGKKGHMNQHQYFSNRLFCLAVSGLCLAAPPVSPAATANIPPFPAKTVYNGLVYPVQGTVPSETGYFRVDVSRNGHFTGKLRVGAHHAGFSGKLNAGGAAYVPVKVGTGEYEAIQNPDLSVDYREIQKLEWTLVLQVTNELQEVAGQIFSYEHAGWGGIMLGERGGYSTTNPAPQAGRYTVIFPGDPSGQSGPEGDGYAALTVDKAGNVRLVGALADDSTMTASSVLTADGVWPLFVPSDGGRGMLVGWLQFTNSSEGALAGQLTWVRSRHPEARFYAEGFTNQTSVLASAYVRPSSDQAVLNLSNAVMVLRGGELSASFTNSLTLRTATEFSGTADSRLMVRFYPANGLFLGTAHLAGVTRTFGLKGAVLQDRILGFGYFRGGVRNGELIMQEALMGGP
jgi:hypothetical protein